MITLDASNVARVVHEEHEFTFDRVFGPATTQAEVFSGCASAMVDDVLEGFNATIFAYGQTSSGKTHTMMGPDVKDAEMMGIIPRVVRDIFRRMDGDVNTEYEVTVSYFEIYLERVRDLLNPTQGKLAIRENKARGVFVQGLTERRANSADEVLAIMEAGGENRKVSSTDMNAVSSRSHSLFQMTVRGRNQKDLSEKTAKLNLVDLAGSEAVKKTNATGDRLEEAKNINTSLTALGKVIYALTDGKSRHIPYRESKLTRVLSESLGGNSLTLLIINASPSSFNASETLSTLRFGKRAKQIKNVATVNAKRSPAEMELHIARLEKTIAKQRGYIAALEAELSTRGGADFVASMAASMDSDISLALPPVAEPEGAEESEGAGAGPTDGALPAGGRSRASSSAVSPPMTAEFTARIEDLEAQLEEFEEENARLSLANNALLNEIELARDSVSDDSAKVDEVKRKWKKAKVQMKAHSDKLVKQNTALKKKVRALQANYAEVMAVLETFTGQEVTAAVQEGGEVGADVMEDVGELDVSVGDMEGGGGASSSAPTSEGLSSLSHKEVMARVAEGLSTIQKQKLELSVVNTSIMESHKSLAESEAKVSANLEVLGERERNLSEAILAKQEELGALDDDRADLDALISSLSSDKATLQAEVSLLQSRKDEMTGSMAELKLRIAAASAEHDAKAAAARSVEDALADAKDQLAITESALAKQDAQKKIGMEALMDLKAKIEAGQAEVRRLSGLEQESAVRLEELTSQAEKLSSVEVHLAEVEALLGPKAEELEGITGQLESARASKESAEADAAEAREEASALRASLKEMEARVESASKEAGEAEEKASALGSSVAQLSTEAEELETVVSRLRAESETLKPAVSSLSEKKEELESSVGTLRSSVAVVEERVAQGEAKLAKIQAEVASGEEEVSSVSANLESLKAEAGALASQVAADKAEIVSMEKVKESLAAATVRESELQVSLARLSAQEETLSASVSSKQERVNALEIQLETQRDEKVELATAMGLLQGEKSALASSLETVQTRLEATQGDLDRAVAAKKEAVASLEDAQIELDEVRGSLDKVKGVRDDLQEDVDDLETRRASLAATVESLEAEQGELASRLDGLNTSIDSQTSAIASESAKAQNAEAALVEAKMSLAQYKFERDEALLACSHLEDRYLKLQKRFNDLALELSEK